MKLRKLIVALGISACLVVPQAQPALGVSYAAESTDKTLLASDDTSSTAVDSKEDSSSTEDSSKQEDSVKDQNTSDKSDSTESESSSTDQSSSVEDKDSKNTSNETDASTQTDSKNTDASSSQNSSQTETNSTETTDSQTSVSSQNNTSSTTETNSDKKSTTKKKTDKKSKKEKESKKNALKNLQSNTSYTPSSAFIDDSKKVKYSTDVPIDGLPEFITQEMIVGALKCQDEYGYPASVTIAQIIQESGYGKYGPGGTNGKGLSYLAFQYNNLFGIKGTGTAGSVVMKTGEQKSDGTTYSTSAYFRSYNTYTECIEDRAELLERRYSDLLDDVTDANTFAMRIARRWATSLSYGQDLIKQMEKYDLYRLDDMTLDDFDDLLGTFVNPCPGATITSNFGFRDAPTAGATTYHQGIDLGTGGYNLPTYAAESGTVIYAGSSGASGKMIAIDHGNGVVTKYGHHDKIFVKVGDKVEKGQQIGLAGSTGVSTGIHLHFQVEVNGQAVNPLVWLNEQN
jgi:murein DD-endopeptidase MepM/ murein hydrolase activator NlpD